MITSGVNDSISLSVVTISDDVTIAFS